VRSRADLEKLAAELECQYTVVFSDDDHFIAMKNGRTVKRFRTMARGGTPGLQKVANMAELPSRGHLFLMYDEFERGTELEARLLMEGLQKGERCLYVTHMDVDVAERTLSGKGLPIEEPKAKNLIKILRIDDPFQDDRGWTAAVGGIIEEIMSNGPDRIVSWRWIRDLADDPQMAANRLIERHVNAAVRGEPVDATFEPLRNFGGLFVCSYSVSNIVPKALTFEWFTNHLANHDVTVFAARNGSVLLSNGFS
jgi:hypothetical protein